MLAGFMLVDHHRVGTNIAGIVVAAAVVVVVPAIVVVVVPVVVAETGSEAGPLRPLIRALTMTK